MGSDTSKLRSGPESLPSIKLPASASYYGGMYDSKDKDADKQEISRSRTGSASSRSGKHPLPVKMRRLIQSCFLNPHELVGRRIMKRACEMKKEFATFYMSLEQEQRDDIEENMKLMLKKVVTNIDFVDEIQRLAEEFGQRFVALRPLGFRPDLFPVIADATIKECTHLDSAVHKAHTTTHAFSQFGALVFASVREGFYTEVRRLRRASASFSTGSNGSARRRLTESSFINENGSIKSRGNSPRQSHSRCQSRSASPDSSGSDELCPNTPIVGGTPATHLKPPTNAMVAARSY